MSRSGSARRLVVDADDAGMSSGADTALATRASGEQRAPGPAFPSPHLGRPGDFETIDPEGARIRTEAYAPFRTGRIRDWIEALGIGIAVIGMKPLRTRPACAGSDTRTTGPRRGHVHRR